MDEANVNTSTPLDRSPAPPGTEEAKTYTQEEVTKLLQSEAEKHENQALSSFKETELPKLLESAKSEAEKLAKMNAEQKAEYERQTREADFAARAAELTRKELRIEAHKALTEKGLPAELLDALNYSDAAACKASLEAVEKAVRAGIEAGVNQRLQTDPPKKAANANGDEAVKGSIFAAFGIK